MPAIVFGLAAALIVVFVVTASRDPRWIGNAFLLTGAGATLVVACIASSVNGRSMPGTGPLALLALSVAFLSPLLVIGLITFLLVNGLTMARREGRSLGNLLSLLAALGLIGVVVLGFVCLFGTKQAPILFPLGLAMLLATTWLGFLFTVYVVYTLVYPRLVRRRGARYVVVHGSGLIGAKVPPLLAARVDAGIGLWRRLVADDPTARIVMSGGQGPDEARSEASAMAEYAIERGVPTGAILVEDTSRTTAENLRNTRDLVTQELGSGARGLAVTSSYHVLRTAALARSIGLDVQVQPARVARYFWPSAFLRELVALVENHRVAHALVAAAVVLPLPLAFTYAMFTPGR